MLYFFIRFISDKTEKKYNQVNSTVPKGMEFSIVTKKDLNKESY